MNKLKFLIALLFLTSLSMNAQTKNHELRLKKAVSKFSQKVNKTESKEKKKKILDTFVTKLEEIKENSVLDESSSDLDVEFDHILDNLIESYSMVENGNGSELDDYADFVESEFNQSGSSGELLIYLGAALLPIILIVILL